VESDKPKGREPAELSRLPAPPATSGAPAASKSSPAPGLLPKGASIPFRGPRTLTDDQVAPASYAVPAAPSQPPNGTEIGWRAR
jgi:hypothetical protein